MHFICVCEVHVQPWIRSVQEFVIQKEFHKKNQPVFYIHYDGTECTSGTVNGRSPEWQGDSYFKLSGSFTDHMAHV